MELEQYELAIEEQAYPFEEKAIQVHESNLQLISRGVYNAWIEKSLQKLAEFIPARYDRITSYNVCYTKLLRVPWRFSLHKRKRSKQALKSLK